MLALALMPSQRKPAPQNPQAGQGVPAPGTSAGPVTRFVAVTPIPSQLTIQTNETLLAEVSVPWFASGMVNTQKIQDGLAEKGLFALNVNTQRPAYWPLLSEADYYVTAANVGPTKSFELPAGISRLWRVQRA